MKKKTSQKNQIMLTFTPNEFQELLHILDIMADHYNENNQEYTVAHKSLARKIYMMSDKILAKKSLDQDHTL